MHLLLFLARYVASLFPKKTGGIIVCYFFFFLSFGTTHLSVTVMKLSHGGTLPDAVGEKELGCAIFFFFFRFFFEDKDLNLIFPVSFDMCHFTWKNEVFLIELTWEMGRFSSHCRYVLSVGNSSVE